MKGKDGGFTLVEMMVSVALFSVVLVVTLGTIMTIVDSNKKARSLMSVMNNLNFAVDSMTRSLKAGTEVTASPSLINGNCVSTRQIDYANVTAANPFARRWVTYCLRETGDVGRITRKVGTDINQNGTEVDLTSPDVDIDYLTFTVWGSALGSQPRILIKMEGTVKITEKIKSNFTIQTTVSQRQLNI